MARLEIVACRHRLLLWSHQISCRRLSERIKYTWISFVKHAIGDDDTLSAGDTYRLNYCKDQIHEPITGRQALTLPQRDIFPLVVWSFEQFSQSVISSAVKQMNHAMSAHAFNARGVSDANRRAWRWVDVVWGIFTNVVIGPLTIQIVRSALGCPCNYFFSHWLYLVIIRTVFVSKLYCTSKMDPPALRKNTWIMSSIVTSTKGITQVISSCLI